MRPCRYAYGSCAGVGVKVHPSYANRDNLLKDEQGALYCFEGRFLTLDDTICEKCGENLEPSRNECEEGIIAYRCPNCKNLVKMEV